MTTGQYIGIIVAAAILAVAAVFGIGYFTSAGPLPGATSRAPNVDLSVKSLTTTADSTFGGGTVTITHSNTATSSAIFGCWQSYATSTATALKLQFTASTTAPTNGSGVIPVISYGTCPNL